MSSMVIDVKDSRWLEALSGLRYDVYHLPEYLSLEAKRTQAIARALLVEDGGKKFFVPFLIRIDADINGETGTRVIDVALPYGYPGIIFNEIRQRCPQFVEFSIHELRHTIKEIGACTVFVRLHFILSHFPVNVDFPDIVVSKTSTISVDLLLSTSQIWANTRKGHQSTINKAKRLGYVVRMVNFVEYEEEFTSIYEETMTRVGSQESYYFGTDYFQNLDRLVDQLHLCVAEMDRRVVAPCIFFECNGIVHAHLGGTRSVFLKDSPFSLLLHFVRLWGKDRGNEVLHLRGGLGGTQDCIYRYKSGFSRQRHDFLTMRWVLDATRYRELVELRAKSCGMPASQLLHANFFPAYRYMS